jgi:hypothetical protein
VPIVKDFQGSTLQENGESMKPGNAYLALPASFLLLAILSACAHEPAKPDGDSALSPTADEINSCPNGYSGMANIHDDRYLVVHDLKAHRNGNRLSVIQTVIDQNVNFEGVQVADWKHADGQASDLEAVCKVPGTDEEFLAAESGHWEGKYGRMFHLKLDTSRKPYSASVIHAYDLPEFDAKGPDDPHGDEFEGMECVAIADNNVLVLLAERGGSPVYPAGLVRWFTVDPDSKTLSWTSDGRKGKSVNPPGVMNRSLSHRDITALYLDKNQALWAVGAEDAGESGPFSSYLYQIGSVGSDPHDPLQLIENTVAERIMSGLKTEALAGPTTTIPESSFSIGTEDECLGGIWRALK